MIGSIGLSILDGRWVTCEVVKLGGTTRTYSLSSYTLYPACSWEIEYMISSFAGIGRYLSADVPVL